MLHILWMKIKFILLTLGILLGLALLLVLFCPVRYQVKAKKMRETPVKETSVTARVSWLFRGITLKILLENGKPHLTIRILGIPVNRVIEYVKKRKKKVSKTADAADRNHAAPKNMSENFDDASDIKKETNIGEAANPEEACVQELALKDSAMTHDIIYEECPKNRKEPASEIPEDISSDSSNILEAGAENSGLFSLIMGRIKSAAATAAAAIKKIVSFPKVLTDKIRKITLTIRGFCGKIDWWKKFFSHPRTKEALSLVWTDVKKLIRHILPTKMGGQVTFGSEDPSITGAVLAALGISFPLHKNRVEVTPLFEGENVLEGSIRLKGRIYGCIFIKTAIQIYFNKNVKYVIRRWKRKEG